MYLRLRKFTKHSDLYMKYIYIRILYNSEKHVLNRSKKALE